MNKIAIVGANGRMGVLLIEEILKDDELQLTTAIVQKESGLINTDVGNFIKDSPTNIYFSYDMMDKVNDFDILIDFTSPLGTMSHVEFCKEHKKAIIIGTTGFSEEQEKTIEQASKIIPIMKSANYSIGINVLFNLIKQATETLVGYDIEIIETHHNKKLDAPSGTALAIGKQIANTLNVNFNEKAIFDRNGIKPRLKGDIGFSSIRAGNIVGEHIILFSSENESIEIKHNAYDRKLFTKGALTAAKWIINKPPGLYDMLNVLNIK